MGTKPKWGNRKRASLSKVRHKAEYETVDVFKEKGYPVTEICKLLNISRSAYYNYKNRVKPEKKSKMSWFVH